MNTLDIVGSLVLGDGRQWADAATDVQVADMTAWAADPRPFHFCTRARGYGKTSDVAAFLLAEVICNPACRAFWMASDLDQGRFAILAITGYLQRTPGLADRVRRDEEPGGGAGRWPA